MLLNSVFVVLAVCFCVISEYPVHINIRCFCLQEISYFQQYFRYVRTDYFSSMFGQIDRNTPVPAAITKQVLVAAWHKAAQSYVVPLPSTRRFSCQSHKKISPVIQFSHLVFLHMLPSPYTSLYTKSYSLPTFSVLYQFLYKNGRKIGTSSYTYSCSCFVFGRSRVWISD
jgi:hypothetical protein